MSENLREKIIRSLRSVSNREIDIVLSGMKFTIKNVPMRKISNWIINGVCAQLRTKHAAGYPTQTQVVL